MSFIFWWIFHSLSFCCLVYIHSMIFGSRQHFHFSSSICNVCAISFYISLDIFSGLLSFSYCHSAISNILMAVSIFAVFQLFRMHCAFQWSVLQLFVLPFFQLFFCCNRFTAAFDKWKLIYLLMLLLLENKC